MNRSNPQDIVTVLAALRSAQYAFTADRAAPDRRRDPLPFVTVSRQAGAGGRSLATRLVDRLNQLDPGPLKWTVWDNELVERVATGHHVPAARIAALEDERPSWLEAALGSMTAGGAAAGRDELAVYHRVSSTMRALAQMGRVVIVGRGGAFVTADMPGGVHVRLVAPADWRVSGTARARGLSPAAAARWVRDRDRNRAAFYRRHWPDRPLAAESFTATFNTAAAAVDRIADAILPLVRPAAIAQTAAASAAAPTAQPTT